MGVIEVAASEMKVTTINLEIMNTPWRLDGNIMDMLINLQAHNVLRLFT